MSRNFLPFVTIPHKLLHKHKPQICKGIVRSFALLSFRPIHTLHISNAMEIQCFPSRSQYKKIVATGSTLSRKRVAKERPVSELSTADDRSFTLQDAWSIHFHPRQQRGGWNAHDSQKAEDIGDVAIMWQYLNNIPWSDLHVGCDVLIFKKGIQPTWEDPANAGGGRWSAEVHGSFKLDARTKNKAAASLWQDLVLLCLGHTFPHVDLITGVAIGVRGNGNTRVCIWVRPLSRADFSRVLPAIGDAFKKVVSVQKGALTSGVLLPPPTVGARPLFAVEYTAHPSSSPMRR